MTMTDIKPGQIKLLWSVGHYDGMTSAIGMLDDQYVYLDIENWRGWTKKKEWRDLDCLLEKLLREKDQEWIGIFLENHYENEMMYEGERIYNVRIITPSQFEKMKEAHRQFQIHVGMHCDYAYVEGKPKRHQKEYWGNSHEYHKAHYYDVVAKDKHLMETRNKINESDIIGTITWTNLFARSDHPSDLLEDPRSEEIKQAQKRNKDDRANKEPHSKMETEKTKTSS